MGNVMDVIIAVIVISAVIFFGALISIGNERQRKAIDLLRREADDYFKQDLRLKRGAAAQAVKIEIPASWLSTVFSKAFGETLALTVDHYVTEPDCLVALDSVGRNILFTTVPPDNLKRMSRGHKQSRLGVGHPLLPLRRGLDSHRTQHFEHNAFIRPRVAHCLEEVDRGRGYPGRPAMGVH